MRSRKFARIDELTIRINEVNLMTYVRFIGNDEFTEEMFFCEIVLPPLLSLINTINSKII